MGAREVVEVAGGEPPVESGRGGVVEPLEGGEPGLDCARGQRLRNQPPAVPPRCPRGDSGACEHERRRQGSDDGWRSLRPSVLHGRWRLVGPPEPSCGRSLKAAASVTPSSSSSMTFNNGPAAETGPTTPPTTAAANRPPANPSNRSSGLRSKRHSDSCNSRLRQSASPTGPSPRSTSPSPRRSKRSTPANAPRCLPKPRDPRCASFAARCTVACSETATAPDPSARLPLRVDLRVLRLLRYHDRVPAHPASPTRRRRQQGPGGT